MLVHVNDVVLVGTVHADLDGLGRMETVLQALQPRVVAVETNAERAKAYNGRFEYDALSIYRDAQTMYSGLVSRYQADAALFDQARLRYGALPVDWSARQIAAMEAGAHLLCACYGFELRVAKAYVDHRPGAVLVYIDLPEENVDPIRQAVAPSQGRPPVQNLRFFADNRSALDHGLLGYIMLLRALQDGYYDESSGVLRQRYEENVANWRNLPAGDVYRRAVYDPRREPHMADQIKRLCGIRPHQRVVAIVGATHLVGLSRLLAGVPHSSLSLFEVDVLRRLAA